MRRKRQSAPRGAKVERFLAMTMSCFDWRVFVHSARHAGLPVTPATRKRPAVADQKLLPDLVRVDLSAGAVTVATFAIDLRVPRHGHALMAPLDLPVKNPGGARGDCFVGTVFKWGVFARAQNP
jgi:hypothetical protein